MGSGQGVLLKLVPQDGAGEALRPDRRSEAQSVFAHWVWMMGKRASRVAFGPKRRRAVYVALTLYEADQLLAAIEGCASSPFHRGENDRDTAYDDIDFILRDERNIERFSERGYKLREAARRALEREAGAAQDQTPEAAPVDPAELAAQRERVRQMAAQLAGRRHG